MGNAQRCRRRSRRRCRRRCLRILFNAKEQEKWHRGKDWPRRNGTERESVGESFGTFAADASLALSCSQEQRYPASVCLAAHCYCLAELLLEVFQFQLFWPCVCEREREKEKGTLERG